MKIKTNNQWRDFLYRSEIPESVLKNEFDWLDENEGMDGFIKYKGDYYHISEFMTAPEGLKEKGWSGIHTQSAFSAILIQPDNTGESYKVGLALT